MRTRYKNKRDFYKGQMEIEKNEKEIAQARAKKAEDRLKQIEEEKKKWFKCTIYCSNCQTVYGASVPNGVPLHESGCAWCGVRNASYLVREIKNSI